MAPSIQSPPPDTPHTGHDALCRAQAETVADIPLATTGPHEITPLTFVDDSGRGLSHCNAKVMGGCLRYQHQKTQVTNIFPGLNRL